MAYSPTTWVNNTTPYINATNLNKIENGIDEAHDQIAKKNVLTKTANYTITSDDFGKSIRMNSGSDYIFTLPSVGAGEDGARLILIKQGAGKVTVQAADTDTILDSSAGGTIYNDTAAETYATLVLEYVHGNTAWVIISGLGIWSTT